jgi:hypothetical protein
MGAGTAVSGNKSCLSSHRVQHYCKDFSLDKQIESSRVFLAAEASSVAEGAEVSAARGQNIAEAVVRAASRDARSQSCLGFNAL